MTVHEQRRWLTTGCLVTLSLSATTLGRQAPPPSLIHDVGASGGGGRCDSMGGSTCTIDPANDAPDHDHHPSSSSQARRRRRMVTTRRSRQGDVPSSIVLDPHRKRRRQRRAPRRIVSMDDSSSDSNREESPILTVRGASALESEGTAIAETAMANERRQSRDGIGPVSTSAGRRSPSSAHPLSSKKTMMTTSSSSRRSLAMPRSPSSARVVSVSHRGGGTNRVGNGNGKSNGRRTPSMYWAVLHNWMYFLSLGFNGVNIPFLVRSIIDGPDSIKDRSNKASPEAIALSGKVESVDKFLTFSGIGLLSALSDTYGRRPLMAWAALGFALTNLIQARTTQSVAALYLADFVDGCTSCMLPLCQAYVADVSPPERTATNLGIFQGLSAGCAFILAFPIGGVLGAKFGPRIPLLVAAGLQLLNALIILLITPESNPISRRKAHIDLREANPIGGLVRLFARAPLLRTASATYLLTCLGRSSLDAQFVNYSNIRFGWTQAQSGPVLVVVGLMLAVAPRIIVPLLGLKNSILAGLLVFAAGLAGAGLAPTPWGFAASIFVVSVGCACLPALQALLANLAPPGERGATLGAVGSLVELTGAIGSTLYASVLATFAGAGGTAAGSSSSSGDRIPPLGGKLPGMHFLVGGALLIAAWAVAVRGFARAMDGAVKDGVVDGNDSEGALMF